MSRLLKSGMGWRLGWHPEASDFPALLGADDWAIELTQAEFEDFCRLFAQLSNTLQQMTAELMDEEAIACEAESDLIWLEVAGFPNAYSLRLILQSGRRGEGYWKPEVVPKLRESLQTLGVF
jgi:Domain of unknown function (DUF1818)